MTSKDQKNEQLESNSKEEVDLHDVEISYVRKLYMEIENAINITLKNQRECEDIIDKHFAESRFVSSEIKELLDLIGSDKNEFKRYLKGELKRLKKKFENKIENLALEFVEEYHKIARNLDQSQADLKAKYGVFISGYSKEKVDIALEEELLNYIKLELQPQIEKVSSDFKNITQTLPSQIKTACAKARDELKKISPQIKN